MNGPHLSTVTTPVGQRDYNLSSALCKLKCFRCNAYKMGGRGERSIASRISLESAMREWAAPVSGHRPGCRARRQISPASPASLSALDATLTKNRGPSKQLSRPGKVYQDHVRMLLHSLENNVLPVGRDVEVADVEVGCDVGQLALHARLQID
jgi:hypothetical protein